MSVIMTLDSAASLVAYSIKFSTVLYNFIGYFISELLSRFKCMLLDIEKKVYIYIYKLKQTSRLKTVQATRNGVTQT